MESRTISRLFAVAPFLSAIALLMLSGTDGQDAGPSGVVLNFTFGGNRTPTYQLGSSKSSIILDSCQVTVGSYTMLRWIHLPSMTVISSTPLGALNFKWSAGGTISQSDAGIYRCQSMSGTFVTEESGDINITVADPLAIPTLPAAASPLNRATQDITCVATGYQVYANWTAPAGAVFSVSMTRSLNMATSTLTIASVDFSRDAGQYTCHASSSAICNTISSFATTVLCSAAVVTKSSTVSVRINPPAAVNSLEHRSVTSNGATLVWQQPSEIPPGIGLSPITHYSVSCWSVECPSTPCTIPATGLARNASTAVTVPIASPQISYVVYTVLPHHATACFVAAVSAGGMGADKNVTFVTLEGNPLNAPRISLNPATKDSVYVKFYVPASGRSGFITRFNVTYSADCSACPGCCSTNCQISGSGFVSRQSGMDFGRITYHGLCNSVGYSMIASACTAAGCGPVSAEYFATSDGVPSQPEHYSSTTLSSSAIFLTWKDPAIITFGPYRKFIVMVAAANGDYADGSCTLNVNSTTAASPDVVPGRVTNASITNLCPGTTYSFTLIAKNNEGIATVTSTASTAEGVPSAPTQVNAVALNSTAAEFLWTLPVNRQAGMLAYFSVHYVAHCDTSCCCRGDCASEVTVQQSVTGSVWYSATALDLCPSTTYSVDIAAANRAQVGPASAAVTVAIPDGAPGTVSSARCNVSDVVPHLLIELQWRRPQILNGEILGYTATLWQKRLANVSNATTSIASAVYSGMVPLLDGSSKAVGNLDDGDVIITQDNETIAKTPELTEHAVYDIAEGSVYYYVITAQTAGGVGPAAIVNCSAGWTRPPKQDVPTTEDDTTTIVVVVVVLLIVAIVLAAIITYLYKKRHSTDGPVRRDDDVGIGLVGAEVPSEGL